MAIRARLTTRDGGAADKPSAKTAGGQERTDEEKATRKARVEAVKDALKRSTALKGEHVPPARAALKLFLQRLNEPRQPDDATFTALTEAPFRVPPKKRETRR